MCDENDVRSTSLVQGSNSHFHGAIRETFSLLPTISEASDMTSQKSFIASDTAGALNNLPTDNMTEFQPSQHRDQDGSAEEPDGIDVDQELPIFNWMDLENQFTEALQLLDKEEGQILDEFDHLMEVSSTFSCSNIFT